MSQPPATAGGTDNTHSRTVMSGIEMRLWLAEDTHGKYEANADEIAFAFTDAELVAAVLAGDETAFARIFERHKRTIANIAARYFHRRELAEEAVQTAFTNVYFALDKFNGEHSASFSSWLARIAHNACLDVLRKHRRKPESLTSELSEAQLEQLHEGICDERAENAEQKIINQDLAEKLLAQLEPEEAMILQMLEAAEMSINEIAEATGWSTSNVKVRAHRARKKMAAALRRLRIGNR